VIAQLEYAIGLAMELRERCQLVQKEIGRL
jgi:hypothetical protein